MAETFNVANSTPEFDDYRDRYWLALEQLGTDPVRATKEQRATARLMVEAAYRGKLDRERIKREATK